VYREAEAREPDREGPAVEELERRVQRARLALVFGGLTLTFLAGALGFWLVLEAQFAMTGQAEVRITALLGFGVPILVGFRELYRRVPRIIARMVERWLPKIAAKHGVMVENLAEYTSHLR
jgi:hypothetical protein